MQSLLEKTGNLYDRPPFPFPPPRFTLWQPVQYETPTEQALEMVGCCQTIDPCEMTTYTAIVCGMTWESGQWHYLLYYPVAPNTWLPDHWFENDPIPESELSPVK